LHRRRAAFSRPPGGDQRIFSDAGLTYCRFTCARVFRYHTAHPQDAFYPFTLPLTVGPGAISVAIALGTQRPRAANLYDLIILGGAAISALLAMSATIFVCYRFAELIVATLGERGTTVLVRLSAFVLLCIGIEIISSGYSALPGIGR